MELESALVRRVWTETPRLSGVILEVSAEIAAAHRYPGQVLSVATTAGHPAYFAIASAPGEARALELLVDVEGAPVPLNVGAVWQIGPPTGEGFDVAAAKGCDILVMAQGSAVAALKPVIEVIRSRRADFGTVTGFFTARDASDFAYAEQYGAWAADGIEVHRILGEPFMQERLAAQKPNLQKAVSYVCGSPLMMDDVSERLVSLGHRADAIYRNW